jgi:hypothetical protein
MLKVYGRWISETKHYDLQAMTVVLLVQQVLALFVLLVQQVLALFGLLHVLRVKSVPVKMSAPCVSKKLFKI